LSPFALAKPSKRIVVTFVPNSTGTDYPKLPEEPFTEKWYKCLMFWYRKAEISLTKFSRAVVINCTKYSNSMPVAAKKPPTANLSAT
jgi:hypothetical protein